MPIPIDTAVRMGKLPNGLTYYIRHNNTPEHRVNFYLVQRVGSLQEEDNQCGLAHFLEHMCFNGTKHFPGDKLISYLETLGVRFGNNLNAHTSMDKTVYNINDVPTTRISALDSCLLILRDWSDGLMLDPREIDKERGVIHEEWRLRTSPMSRMMERNLKKLYPGSKYGERMPIGKMEIVDSFKPSVLQTFYRKWYRPENQAVIVVGDIDVNCMEARIRKLFGSLRKGTHASRVTEEPVPDNTLPIIVVDKDKELQGTFLQLMFKCNPIPPSMKSTEEYLAYLSIKDMTINMLRNRIIERTQTRDCPYIQAAVGYGTYLFSKTKYAFQMLIAPKEGMTEQSIETIMEETLRAIRFGFTPTELARAKAHSLNFMKMRYDNRHKRSNALFGNEYTEHFLSHEPIPSMEDLYALKTGIIHRLTVEDANQFMRKMIPSTDSNVVIINFNSEKDNAHYSTPQTLETSLRRAIGKQLTPYVDHVKDEPLIKTLPTKGRIMSSKENKTLGYKELGLSNGARVILKKTDFKKEEVLLEAFSYGGSSLLEEKDYLNIRFFNQAISHSGLGSFSLNELQKALAGKTANVNLTLSLHEEKVVGMAVPKDLESLFQQTYLYFTDIRKDESSFGNLLNRYRTNLSNKSLSPDMALSDSLNNTLHAHDPRYFNLNVDDLDKVDYDRILQIAKERTADASDFTFIFVGNFEENTILPLVEQYIASLPANGKREHWRNVLSYAKGKVTNIFRRKMETPKAQAYMFWYADQVPNTLENKVKSDAVGQLLTALYIKKIREDASAAYSANGQGTSVKDGDKTYVKLYGICPMKPEKSDVALKIMREEVERLACHVDANMLEGVKQYMRKKGDEDSMHNKHWLKVIGEFERNGLDIHTDYQRTVDELTPTSISSFVRDVILASGNHIEVVMLPE